MNTSKEWFRSWFASPYYFKLYKHRNNEEASLFITKLIALLGIKETDLILDAACGKGRHSIHLNSLGFDVTGIDLSEPSIAIAKKDENKTLRFHVHDIRNNFKNNHFDHILNLFTSFGYFADPNDNLKCLLAFKNGINQNGNIIIDFMNAKKAINHMVEKDEKTIDGTHFKIEKRIESGFIKKKISFIDNNENMEFEESVQALMIDDFERLFNRAGLKIKNIFGDYELNHFDEIKSDRLIFHTKKI